MSKISSSSWTLFRHSLTCWARVLHGGSANLSRSIVFTRGSTTVRLIALPSIAEKSFYDRIIESSRPGVILVDGPLFHSDFQAILRPQKTSEKSSSVTSKKPSASSKDSDDHDKAELEDEETSSSSKYTPKFSGVLSPPPPKEGQEGQGKPGQSRPLLPAAVHNRIGAAGGNVAVFIKQPWEAYVRHFGKVARWLGEPIRKFFFHNPNMANRKYFEARLRGTPFIRSDRDMDALMLIGLLLWCFSGHFCGPLTLFYFWKYDRENHLLRTLQRVLNEDELAKRKGFYTICWGAIHYPRLEVHLLRAGFTVQEQTDLPFVADRKTALWAKATYIYSLPLISLFGVYVLALIANALNDWCDDEKEAKEVEITA